MGREVAICLDLASYGRKPPAAGQPLIYIAGVHFPDDVSTWRAIVTLFFLQTIDGSRGKGEKGRERGEWAKKGDLEVERE